MIKKLNFYDLYGYVLPGFLLIVLLWLPFGLVRRAWPEVEWGSATATLALSYVVGVVLQTIASKALPSKVPDRGKLRHPSDIVLDKEDATLPPAMKEELRTTILTMFRLNIDDESSRAAAFRLCRAALIARKYSSYAEQFQGMYALVRGILLAIGLAVVFLIGWALTIFRGALTAFHWWSVLAPAAAVGLWLYTWHRELRADVRAAQDRQKKAPTSLDPPREETAAGKLVKAAAEARATEGDAVAEAAAKERRAEETERTKRDAGDKARVAKETLTALNSAVGSGQVISDLSRAEAAGAVEKATRAEQEANEAVTLAKAEAEAAAKRKLEATERAERDDAAVGNYPSEESRPHALVGILLVALGVGVRYLPAGTREALFEDSQRSALWVALPFAMVLALVLWPSRLGSSTSRIALAAASALVTMAAGFDSGSTMGVTQASAERLFVGALGGALLLLPLGVSYRMFATEFATTIYRDFYAMAKWPVPESNGPWDDD